MVNLVPFPEDIKVKIRGAKLKFKGFKFVLSNSRNNRRIFYERILNNLNFVLHGPFKKLRRVIFGPRAVCCECLMKICCFFFFERSCKRSTPAAAIARRLADLTLKNYVVNA